MFSGLSNHFLSLSMIYIKFFLFFLLHITHQQKLKVESSADSAAPRRGRRPVKRDTETAEKKKKPEDVRTECTTCKQTGTNANLVRYKSFPPTWRTCSFWRINREFRELKQWRRRGISLMPTDLFSASIGLRTFPSLICYAAFNSKRKYEK